MVGRDISVIAQLALDKSTKPSACLYARMLLLLSKDGKILLNRGQALCEKQVMLSVYQLVNHERGDRSSIW